MSQSVNVASFATTAEAEVVRHLLEANGVRAAVVADDGGGLFPPLTNEAKVLVLEEDAPIARQILETAD